MNRKIPWRRRSRAGAFRWCTRRAIAVNTRSAEQEGQGIRILRNRGRAVHRQQNLDVPFPGKDPGGV